MRVDPAALDRARGALLGLACEDALGTMLEFKPPDTFEPISDMNVGQRARLTLFEPIIT